MRSDSHRYRFPNLLEALFIVVVLIMIEYLMNSIIWSINRSAGLQPRAIAGIGRVLANGLEFTVLLYHGTLSCRSRLHDSVDSRRSTLGRFFIPILLTPPRWIVVVLRARGRGIGACLPVKSLDAPRLAQASA